MMAPGSQYLEENGNASPKATRNGKGGAHLPRSDESKMWDLDGDGGKKKYTYRIYIYVICIVLCFVT